MAEFPLANPFVDAIKRFEGFAPRAQWDYKQSSVGYGTKARYPGEVIDQNEAEGRLGSELGYAASAVDRAFPGLAEGPRAALTSLTFNAGPGWINSGLGKAVGSGDMDAARNLFTQYVKAGGRPLQGLIDRRKQEAQWFSGDPLGYTAGGSPGGLPQQASEGPGDLPFNAQPTSGTLPQGNRTMPGILGNGPQGGGLLSMLPGVGGYLGDRRNAISAAINPNGNVQLGAQLDQRLVDQRKAEADQAQQQQLIFQALTSAGAPPQLAAAGASNPDVFKTIAPQFLDNKPKLTETGTNPLTGQKTFAWENPRAQTLTPATVPGEQKPGGAGDLLTDSQGLSGPDYLSALKAKDSMVANTVSGILEGRMQPPTSFAASKPYWQAILAHAANAEPGFDLTKWQSRVGTMKDFASGQAAKNVTSLNTVIGHLGSLKDSVDKLDNSNFTPANALKNSIQVLGGRPEPGNFNVARNAVADELARVFRSAGMSDHEINSWKENISAAGSPDQLKGAVSTAVELLNSRLDSLKDQYERGAGKKSGQLLSDKAQKALDDIRVWSSKSASPAAAPVAPGKYVYDPATKKMIPQ
jgi:GH24 family phage-related lysozyme (muramidase)